MVKVPTELKDIIFDIEPPLPILPLLLDCLAIASHPIIRSF
jgi:hypothetical protein